MKRVTPKQVFEALRVLDSATQSLCCSMIEACGSQRAAASRLGISTVHFHRLTNGQSQASPDMLDKMLLVLTFEGEPCAE